MSEGRSTNAASPPAFVVGADLAGPANHGDTAFAWFAPEGDTLQYRGHLTSVSDAAALELITMLTAQGDVVVGLDAPLSYQDGGGFRPGDSLLRQALNSVNAHYVGVMSPTMFRMMALTLRGVILARLFTELPAPPRLVEVHPGAAMALRGARLDHLRAYKTRQPGAGAARQALREWLGRQGLLGLPDLSGSPHLTDAGAAALAAWQWRQGRPAWLHPAEPPLHPYDFAA